MEIISNFGFKLTLLATMVVVSQSVSVEKDLMLTLQEKQTLDKFKEQMMPLLKRDFMKADFYLVRFLRAKNFDMNEAEVMLKENLKWREANKIDTIGQENFTEFRRDYPSSVDTYDLEGRPVCVIDISDWDIRKAVVTGRIRGLVRYAISMMDNITMQVFERQRMGYNVTQWKVLSNAEDFHVITHGCPMCIPFWIQFLRIAEVNYYGWMDELIIINASSSVFTMFEIMKQYMAPRTRGLIHVFGQNKRIWAKYLDARISKSERREVYGGTKPPLNLP